MHPEAQDTQAALSTFQDGIVQMISRPAYQITHVSKVCLKHQGSKQIQIRICCFEFA